MSIRLINAFYTPSYALSSFRFSPGSSNLQPLNSRSTLLKIQKFILSEKRQVFGFIPLLLYPEGGYPHYCYSNIEYTPCLDRKRTPINIPTPEFAQYPAKNSANNSFRKKRQVFGFIPLLLYPEGGYRHFCCLNIEYTPCLDRKQTIVKSPTPEFA